MSGSSDVMNCPRCEGKETLFTSSDYKPYDGVSGECLNCGFMYWTQEGRMGKTELEERRKDYEFEFKHLTKEQEKAIKEWDETHTDISEPIPEPNELVGVSQ